MGKFCVTCSDPAKDSCGHAYFCHTRTDSCTDDTDCTAPATCNYDVAAKRWQCAVCVQGME
jgi:hypothetical protein